DAREQAAVLRPRAAAAAWTPSDLALLDEAEAFVKGASRRFGHVVVDEAQDLSPMQLRMLARRAQHHSMTVLGDLAQATGPASPTSWAATLRHLGRPVNARPAELTMGYRLPGAFLALANRLLPVAAPGVAAPAEIAEEEPHGVRLLFVALTRAVQHLALAHARPLPEPLVVAGAGADPIAEEDA